MKLRNYRVLAATVVAGALLAPASFTAAPDAANAASGQVTNIPLGSGTVESDGTAANSLADTPRKAIMGRAALPDDGELVNMPDPVLRSIVAQKVGESTLTRGGLRKLVSLYVTNSGITDLTGLEYAANLDLVDLSRNAITSIEPLRGLDKIRQLNLNNTQISDISAVSTMPIIDYLQLNWTTVSSLEPIRNHTLLWRIELAGTQVSDMDPVRNLPVLGELYFQETPVSDVSALGTLPKLRVLSAPNTEVSDLHPVAGLPLLSIVNVNSARIADLSMVDTWPNLSQVGFLNQRVTGVPVIASATESTYRTTEATTAPFTMLDDVVLTAKTDAVTTPEGLTIWSDIPADATGLTATVSGDPLPGSGATYSAMLTYPLTRADFTNGELTKAHLESTYSFQLTVDPSFVEGPFSIVAGEVPGLSLSADGALTGTPTEEGTFTLDVRRTDSYGNMIDHTYTIAVGQAIVIDPPVGPTDPPVDPTTPPVDPTTPAATVTSTAPTAGASSGQLAMTGSQDPNGVLAATLLALLAGGALTVAATRRRNAEDAG